MNYTKAEFETAYKDIINMVVFLKKGRKAPDLARYISDSSRRFSAVKAVSKAKDKTI